MQKKMTMEELATKYHNRDTAPRIVGGREIPYIEHPRGVVNRLTSWGCSNELTKEGRLVLDIAWGHDLLEDTRIHPEEIAEVAGEEALRGIELLSNLPEKHPDKAAYIQYVAEQAPLPVLLVKVADRLCNVEDFLVSEGREKAARYFEKAEPVFQRLREEAEDLGFELNLVYNFERPWETTEKHEQWFKDDDVIRLSMLSKILSDITSLGEKIGAHWSWGKQ